MLSLRVGHYIDDFASIFWLLGATSPGDPWGFVLGAALHANEFFHGVQTLFLGMQVSLSPLGLSFCLGPHRREKYAQLLW